MERTVVESSTRLRMVRGRERESRGRGRKRMRRRRRGPYANGICSSGEVPLNGVDEKCENLWSSRPPVQSLVERWTPTWRTSCCAMPRPLSQRTTSPQSQGPEVGAAGPSLQAGSGGAGAGEQQQAAEAATRGGAASRRGRTQRSLTSTRTWRCVRAAMGCSHQWLLKRRRLDSP